MPHYKKLVGEKCYLSPFSLEDAEKWTEWLNDLEVIIPLGNEAYTPVTCEQQKEWMNQSRNQHVFSIIDLKTNQLIGRCMLFEVNMADRNAKVGIVIGEKAYWNNGYGSEAIKLLLDYGFNLLNMNNIMLGAFAFNERAVQCYRKIGFKEIGRRRKARIIGNNQYDIIFMDMLAEEFQSVYVKKFIPKR